jgi:hypothetical protein
VIGWSLSNPAIGPGGAIQIPKTITVTKVEGFCIGGASVGLNIEERTAVESAGTDVLTADLSVDLNGASTTSFANAGIAAGNWLYLDISGVTGATGPVTEVNVSLTYTQLGTAGPTGATGDTGAQGDSGDAASIGGYDVSIVNPTGGDILVFLAAPTGPGWFNRQP